MGPYQVVVEEISAGAAGAGETVRKSVRQAKLTPVHVPGTTTDESAELKRLPRENTELRWANAILKTASIVSSFDQKVEV